MSGQTRMTLSQRRYLAARRDAIHAAERVAMTAAAKPAQPPRAPSRRQLIVIAFLWLAFFAGALWLAAHDPDFLSRAVERAIGGAA